MVWQESTTNRELKAFTVALATSEQTQFKIVPNHTTKNEAVSVRNIQTEAHFFSQACQLLFETKEQEDDQFVAETLPKLQALIESDDQGSPMLRSLQDEAIQVTKGHNQLRPYDHTFNVLVCLDTISVEPEQRFILRVAALYHDIGKASAAGLSLEEVLDMMECYNHTGKHSFPNHDLISAQVTERLVRIDDAFKLLPHLDQKYWSILIMIIDNHHIFEFKVNKDQGINELKELWEMLETIFVDPAHAEAFLLTFMLAFADIHSTPAYRQYWQEKVATMREMIEAMDDKQLLTDFASLATACLGLATEKINHRDGHLVLPK